MTTSNTPVPRVEPSAGPKDTDVLPACIGGLTALAVAGALVPFRDVLGGTNVALVLVVVIVAAAAIGGRLAGAVTALLAALAFNFLYAPPYLTLRIHSTKDIITTVLLFIVGLSVGEIVRFARRTSLAAQKRRLDIGGLHQLSELVQAHARRSVVVDAATELLRCELALADCRYESASDPQSHLPEIDHRGLIDTPLRHAPGGFELPVGGVAVPVVHDDRRVGQFVLVPTPRHGSSLIDRQLVVLVANTAAPALVSIEH